MEVLTNLLASGGFEPHLHRCITAHHSKDSKELPEST